jgi:drug/metabolite transporter (DMT)-like permease
VSNNVLLILCACIWGLTTFMQKLASDKMSPLLMQVVVGTAFIFLIPFFIRVEGGLGHLKWNATSIIITFVAAIFSITANIMMYTALSNNKNTGSSMMLVSLYPVVTLLLSAIFLHEQFSTGKIIGILTMIVGAFLLTYC